MEQVTAESLPASGELEPHPLQPEGGIFLSEPDYLAPVIPISNRFRYLAKVEDLGMRRLIPSKVEGKPARESVLLGINVEGHRQVFWHSEPSYTPEGTKIPDIYVFPFLFAAIEDGFGRDIHEFFAQEFPGARVSTFATNGSGPTGERFNFGRAGEFGIAAMGRQRAAIMELISDDHPVAMIGESIGGAIATEIAIMNRVKKTLDIRFVELGAPAVLIGRHGLVKSVFKLGRQIKHGFGEIVNPFTPGKTKDRVKTGFRNIKQNLRHPSSVAAFLYQGLTVLGHFRQEDVESMLAEYEVGVHLLDEDDVALEALWKTLTYNKPSASVGMSREKGHVQLANIQKVGGAIVERVRTHGLLAK